MLNKAFVRILCGLMALLLLPTASLAEGDELTFKPPVMILSAVPTEETASPAAVPTAEPTAVVTQAPAATPTAQPAATAVPATEAPTAEPAAAAAAVPAAEITAVPAAEASAQPTEQPTEKPMPLGKDDLAVQQALAAQDAAREESFSQAAFSGKKFTDFKFGGVQSLRGIFSKVSLYAELPEYITPKEAVLRLSYTASSLVLEHVSSMTFYMNGVAFASVSVTPSMDQSAQVRYISVPLDLLEDGYNLLEIDAYVRLTDDEEGCSDDYNGANWVKINEETCLRVVYDEVQDTADLSLFPFPFLSLNDASGSNCAVAVSDDAAEDELTAALTLMADLGSHVTARSDIELARISETQRRNIIYFGMEKNTPDELLDLLGETVPRSGALIRRVTAGEKEYLLVITNEEAALLEAARYLADATRVEQTMADSIHISVGEAQTYIDARRKSGLTLEGQYSLKDVLGHGASFTGPFHQEMTIYLPLAQDYALSSEGRFSFNIRYSENLDFERSIMTVYWGSDIPLYSRKLTKDGAAGETVSFAVPADAAGAVSSSMVIAFDLEIEDLDCTPRQLDMPWAYVAEDSSLYLPQGTTAALALGNLPVPFQRSNLFDDVLVVLPDVPTAEELILAGRMMNVLGVGSDPYGELAAIHASRFDEDDHGKHLVVVGTAENNAFIRQMNDQLHFKFNEDGTAVASNDKIVLDDAYAEQVGTLQLLQSPYAADRSVLVASAPGDAGLKALTDRLSQETRRWALGREAVLVDGRGKITTYQFTVTAAEAAEAQKPSFAKVVMENQEPMMMMVIGMGCMLLVLLTAILVLVRIRKNKRDE